MNIIENRTNKLLAQWTKVLQTLKKKIAIKNNEPHISLLDDELKEDILSLMDLYYEYKILFVDDFFNNTRDVFVSSNFFINNDLTRAFLKRQGLGDNENNPLFPKELQDILYPNIDNTYDGHPLDPRFESRLGPSFNGSVNDLNSNDLLINIYSYQKDESGNISVINNIKLLDEKSLKEWMNKNNFSLISDESLENKKIVYELDLKKIYNEIFNEENIEQKSKIKK